jgi:hypothetical protein
MRRKVDIVLAGAVLRTQHHSFLRESTRTVPMSSIPVPSHTRTVCTTTRTDAVRVGARPPFVHGPRSPDEIVIGVALTARWMLSTGRRLDQVPLMYDLTEDQLIDFWADDHRT